MSYGPPVEHLVLVFARVVLGYSCRRYLGRIYNDLRDLSSDPSSSADKGPASPAFELESLPSPVLSPATPGTSAMQHSQMVQRKALSRPAGMRWPAEISLAQFSACFSECCILFILVSCQSANVFDPATRRLQWRISLAIVAFQLIAAFPLLQCLLVTSRTHRSALSRLLFTILPFLGYLFLVSQVSPPATLQAPDFVSAYLARYVVIGVCILGLLSGLGAMQAVWDYILEPFLFSRSKTWKSITDADITSTELAVARVRKDIAEREAQLDRRQALAGDTAPTQGSWVSRVFGSGDKEATMLNTELSSLRLLEGEMAASLARMRARHAELAFGRTFGGVIVGVAWKLFGVYCAARILSTLVAIILPGAARTSGSSTGSSTADIGAQIIGFLLPYMPLLPVEPTAENAAIIARHASLLLVGAIVMSSVRVVLQGANRILRLTGRRRSSSGERSIGAAVMLLLLAQLMGTYLLSTLVSLRTSFPPSGSDAMIKEDESLFASLPGYQPFEPAFNLAFVGAAALTGVYKVVGWAGQ